jgi:cytoskeletal protein CcmA (bactofilin family)
LNSKKLPTTPTIATQQLTEDALKQLANSDATVGGSGQTLTVQGNAVFSGQVLVRSDLSVAGDIKLGGTLVAQNLTASGQVNLADTQINSLQVANGTTFQGAVTIQHDLNVGGTSSFSGPITAGQITVTKLIMSGNAQLQVPNHIAFTGASPSRTSIGAGALGAGGSASVNGSDTTGTINVNTGSGTSPGCFITMRFNQPFSSTPHVLISPVGAAAGQAEYYVNRSSSSFSVCTANAAPANQAFAYDYFITD